MVGALPTALCYKYNPLLSKEESVVIKELAYFKTQFLLVLHVLPQPSVNSTCHYSEVKTVENMSQTGLRLWLRHFAV